MKKSHIEFMRLAINEAKKAALKDEVPVGSVLVSEAGDILALAHNQTIHLADPTAHAEILALRKAGHEAGNYRLPNTTLYITIEPCMMCMGAIIHARVSRIVFGTTDSKWGAAGSLYNFANDPLLNHHPEVIRGVCLDECKALIQGFFQKKRNRLRS